MRNRIGLIVALAAGLTGPTAMVQEVGNGVPPLRVWTWTNSASPAASQGGQLDLTKAFHTRSPWRLVVTEQPRLGVPDETFTDEPGALTLCLHKGPSGPCVSAPVTPTPQGDWDWARYLFAARIVYPKGTTAAPLLLIVTGGPHSGDGDQLIATQLIVYDAGQDAFRRIYLNRTGHNNNQETRFVTEGPLRGRIITAEPCDDPPFGYWVVVKSLTPTGVYRQVLRYRSATLYNDGNPLAVIDSEMPNIQKRLGLWKPGQPLPTPSGQPCPKPTLRHSELWCE